MSAPPDATAHPARRGWRDSAARIAPLAWPVFVGQSLAVLLYGPYQILLYPLLLAGRSQRVLLMAVAAAALNAALNLVLIARPLGPRLQMPGATPR